MRQILRSLGPVLPPTPPVEILRAAFGALAGLGLVGLFVLSPAVNLTTGLFLIAPFGATSVLLFAVPNSPLAQPWSAIVGNTLAAVLAVAVCLVVDDPVLRTGLAVGLAIAGTILFRAVHPPAGAVAMTVAMNPEVVETLGFRFALTPVATGTAALVVLAAIYARMTGRRYPFRQFDEPNRHGTADPEPMERIGLTEEELTGILERYRQSFNLGVEDLARLIGAAEVQAATHRTGPLTAGDIMSESLVVVKPETRASEIADMFQQHGFTSLPVMETNGRFVGIIFQIHLISRAREDALRLRRGFGAAMKRLLDGERDRPIHARDIMSVAVPRATTGTPVAALLPLLSDGEVDAVPVLKDGVLAGIVTRTDLIAALARTGLQEA
ncbi:HPP family protein [Amaricoccus tamworthensis]|uniref:HPP family protein n=1 Tax=Amaricoccus tamworthensis TaxID=57002 RepID=UPI003C79B1DD